MRCQFSGGGGAMLAELDVDTSKASGSGCPEYPFIFWQMSLAILPRNEPLVDYAFRMIDAQLYLVPSGQKISDARPIQMYHVQRGDVSYRTEQHPIFEFPLNLRSLEALERHRDGGSLKLRLDVQLSVDQYGVVPENPRAKRQNVWGLLNVYRLSLQQEIQFSQSDWINHVLPQVGYGKIQIVELPVMPIESVQALDHSFQSLKQAEEKHRLGFYDDAVGKCRTALEKFFDRIPVDPTHPESRKIPVLKKSWEKKLGKSTYDWLNGTLGAIKEASDRTHHSPNAFYSQFDSQMILTITTAVVAYIARTIEAEDLK